MRAQLPSLQGGRRGLLEHLTSLYSGKPKAVSVCIVITSPTAVALDEWSTSKLFQTGPGGCEGLARTFGTSAGVHHKGIANPERGPPVGAGRDLNGLAVHGHHHGRCLAHRTPVVQRKLLINGLMLSPAMGAIDIGMGSGVDNQ